MLDLMKDFPKGTVHTGNRELTVHHCDGWLITLSVEGPNDLCLSCWRDPSSDPQNMWSDFFSSTWDSPFPETLNTWREDMENAPSDLPLRLRMLFSIAFNELKTP